MTVVFENRFDRRYKLVPEMFGGRPNQLATAIAVLQIRLTVMKTVRVSTNTYF
jgi:hypothetical protein